MNVSRLLLGVFGIAVAGTFYVAAGDYPRAAAEMPVIYSVAVGLLSLAMVLDEVIFKRRRSAALEAPSSEAAPDDTERTSDSAPADAPVGKRWVAVVAIFALAVAYVLSLQTLGYILATALFMALALGILGTVRWTFVLIGSAVLIAVICLVFIAFLGLPIPLLPVFA